MSGHLSSHGIEYPRSSGHLSLCLAALMWSATAGAPAVAQRTPQDELAAFPPAPPGQVRRVVFLPREANEDALRVGMIAGRTMPVDCNRHVLGTRFETRTVEGWGYEYLVVTEVGAPATTLMACPPNSQRRRFVQGSDEPLLRYNSRLPIVVFAPADLEVRYRIWRAGREAAAR
jgi:ecotin